MLIDRKVQKELLVKLGNEYPFTYDFSNDYEYGTAEYEKVIANLYYLQSHGLVTDKSIFISKSIGGGKGRIQFGLSEITHKGIDFLQDDGGLSAILSVVTVKFEAETLRVILENRINQSDLDPEHKQSMIDSLRELPAESIKHLTTELLTRGLDNLPAAILLIGTYLGLF